MSVEYRLDVLNRSGVVVGNITDYLYMTYTKQVNAPGLLSFRLPREHRMVSVLEDKFQVEVWRRNRRFGIDWYCDFRSFYRDQQTSIPKSAVDVFTASCEGQMSMLGWRINAYYAGLANRSAFSSVRAETIQKTLINYNFTSNATVANNRDRNGQFAGMTVTVQADAAQGNIISWTCPRKNVLKELQAIALVAGGDFDLIKTGPTTWDFRFYPGQRGTDRTATVKFDYLLGNMSNIQYQQVRSAEKTVAIVGGGNTGASRAKVVRTGPNYSADNDIEIFVDARSGGTDTATLNAQGDKILDELQARTKFDFDPEQIESCRYGKHYFLGDIVLGIRPDRVETDQQVYRVSLSQEKGGDEKVSVELRNV